MTNNLTKQEVTSIITCCSLTLTDGTVMGFTSNSEELSISGIKYKATTLLGLSTIETTDDFSVDRGC